MSVDRTIEELSGTLAQLGVLVEHINAQIVGISSRVNVTLENFDRAVEGIAKDAGFMTGQVSDTFAQIPSSWVFYVLFGSLIVVLALLSVLILLNLVARVRSIYRDFSGGSPSSDNRESYFYADAKQPLTPRGGGTAPQICALPMEAEPKRYGNGGGFSPPPSQAQLRGAGGIDNASYASPSHAVAPHTERLPPSTHLTHRQPYSYQIPQQQQQQQYYSAYAARQPRYVGQSPAVALAQQQQQQRYGADTAVMSRTDSDSSQLSAGRTAKVSPRAEAV